jgi:hypothetical protein
MSKLILFPIEKRRTIAFRETKRNRGLSRLLSAGCFALVVLILIGTAESQSLDGYGFVTGYQPPIQNPAAGLDLTPSPMPPVINPSDLPPGYGAVAPAPEIVSESFLPPSVCPLGSFEIYPDSRLCSVFGSHLETEQHYYHCGKENELLRSVNSVLRDQLNFLSQPQPTPPPAASCSSSIAFGRNGSVWKARSENTNAPVLVLTASVCGNISNVRVEDALGAVRDRGQVRYGTGCRAETNQGRYHQDFLGLRGATGQGFLRFDLNGVANCLNIPEVSRDVR